MCAMEAQRREDCVSAVLHAVLTREATVRAFSTPTGVLGIPDQMRPCGLSTYLPTTLTETLAVSGSDWRMVQMLNLGRTVPRPNYGQRSRRSSPGPAPDPARRRLADIA